jgi:Alpha 1,4-glycosyltransferase conserved region/Glycosyltransferase sugar-binding region containing DXD motif
MNDPIQSLWIGRPLSRLEKLSIESFLDHGHQYHLYAYEELPDLPRGATLRDGNEILPAAQIFQYRERKSYSAFSNVFRYKLLLERGGWWADTDVISLRPLDLSDDYVFASETVSWRGLPSVQALITSCLIKAPRGSPAMALAWRTCLAKDWTALSWGEIGPRLVAQVVDAHGLHRFVQPPTAFCPVPYRDWRHLIEPQSPSLPAEAYAVHFWNEMWRLANCDKDAAYPVESLYELLKRNHPHRTGTDIGAAAIRDA